LSIFPDRATDAPKKTVVRLARAAARRRGPGPAKPQNPRFRHHGENRLFCGAASVTNRFCPMLDAGTSMLYI
jgi:hypothetical protein